MSNNNSDKYDTLFDHFHVLKNEKLIKKDKEYLEYREMWKKTATEHIVTPFPLHLDIEITSYCNLKCPMCPRTHRVEMGEWENINMTFETFKSIIDEGSRLGLKAINLNNFGESMMNKDLVKMIQYAKDNNIIDIMLHTNGTMLNEKLSRDLINSGLDLIIFSVDSITKEIYEKIRLGADYDKTISSIRRFSQLRKELGNKNPIIRVSMVKMKENAHEVDKFEEFWGDDVDLVTYVDYRNQDGLDSVDRYERKKKENKAYCCPSLWQRMTINASGEVTACCRDAGKILILGNLKENSLKEIWDGKKLNSVRQLHLNGEAIKIKACAGCDHIKGHQL